MKELAEDEVVQVHVVDPGLETEERLHYHEDGSYTRIEKEDDLLSQGAFERFMRHAVKSFGDTRRSPHRRGRDLETATPVYMRVAKRRARNKVAKQARKVNRGSYNGR